MAEPRATGGASSLESPPAGPGGSTRRQVLQLLATSAAAATNSCLSWCGDAREVGARGAGEIAPRPGAEEPARTATEGGGAAGDEALDEALRRLQGREPESRQGLSNHAPMVAEALCALGFEGRAVAWVEAYSGPVIELPKPSRRIDRTKYREALGPRAGGETWEAALERWGDWRELFVEELASGPWQDVLDTWTARLAPGICAAATHGVIRTAHAARALSRRRSPERIGELARGLAYWAAAYEEMPARARQESAAPAPTYKEALARVPLYWDKHGQAPPGNIVNGLRRAGELDGFADVRDDAPRSDDVSGALSDITGSFARAYLRHGARHNAIAFIHAITAPCALRRIAPHVRPETARAALPYVWQAAAGIYAAYARRDDPEGEPAPKLSRAEIAGRAVENGDEHAIKLAEALLAEHAIRPDPVYLAAAEDAIARL